MTAWWCEYCHDNHENAHECPIYANRGMGPGALTTRQKADYKRRAIMHAKNPPTKGWCGVIAVLLLGVAVTVVGTSVWGASELIGALLR